MRWQRWRHHLEYQLKSRDREYDIELQHVRPLDKHRIQWIAGDDALFYDSAIAVMKANTSTTGMSM